MPSDNIRDKYLNWLSFIEADYITMFIKTWFTFLASLQDLINNTNDGGRRDNQILDEYKNKLFEEITIQIDDEFIKNVLRAYLQAKNNCLNSNIFLRDYFNIFYRYNENFSQEFTYTYRGKTTKLSLEVYLSSRDKHLKITLIDDRKMFQNYFGDSIETGFLLSNEVKSNNIFEDKGLFINKVLATIRKKAENIVNSNNRLDDKGKQRRINYLNNECLRDIKRELNDKLDITSVFPLRSHNAISNLNPNTLELQNKPQYFEEDLTKWFVDFDYKLRNILFHFIIDPMDKDWQLLFKHSYLALKHLTEENIKLLQNRGVENDNSNL